MNANPIETDYHEIEVDVTYLTTERGGRRSSVFSGYRGQFFYLGDDHDGFQYFPDQPDNSPVPLGTTVRGLVRFGRDRWDDFHSKRMTVGMPFLIREGNKTVGYGVVTKV